MTDDEYDPQLDAEQNVSDWGFLRYFVDWVLFIIYNQMCQFKPQNFKVNIL